MAPSTAHAHYALVYYINPRGESCSRPHDRTRARRGAGIVRAESLP